MYYAIIIHLYMYMSTVCPDIFVFVRVLSLHTCTCNACSEEPWSVGGSSHSQHGERKLRIMHVHV